MKNLNEAVEMIAREIGLGSNEIAKREEFLELTDVDIALLRGIHLQLEQNRYTFTDSFYSHLLKFPPLRTLLPDAATIERLKVSQASYFSSLTEGDYGAEYVRNRLRVGVAHQRIGLEPKWYIGAYRKYLADLMPVLWDIVDRDAEKFLPTYAALLKVVCLDMGLALDTYFQADRQAILQLKNYAEQIVTCMPSGLMVLDEQLHVRSLNRAFRQMLGLAKHKKVEGMPLDGVIQSQQLLEYIGRVQQDGEHQHNLVVMLPGKQGVRHFEFTISSTRFEEEDVLLLMAQDISARLQAETELRESEERFRATFSQAAVGLGHVSPEGRWLRVNHKLCEIAGYSQQELLKLTFQDITHPDDLEDDLAFVRRLLAGEIHDYSLEKRYLRKDGSIVWINLTVSLVSDPSGLPKYFISVVEDISARKRVEGELLHMANHDALTSLPNRLLLQDRLSQVIAYANRSAKQVAVLFIDLDRFKNINDSLGHDVGDKIIMEAGHRLSSSVREGDTVARLGGDEFVIVLTDVTHEGDVSMLAQKILTSLSMPMMLQGNEFFPTGSIGISMYPRDGHDGQSLLKNADTAMYRAKDAGRNNYQFYTQEMNARALDRLKLEARLRHALERDEFVLHYQPQLDIASGGIVGVEALLRWRPPGEKIVSPADFIPIAEETGLIVPIGEWVLRTACAQQRLWQSAGFPPMRMAVNLSARQFKQQDIVKMVTRILGETACHAANLELEITESVIMEQPEMAVETLQQLSDMGVHLSIDDFGTGYSSLSYLKRFPIGTLKIDQSFVRDITTDADDAAIAKAVIALAHSMRLKVIAEGVETAEQLAFLREHQCDQMQGYYFSRPLEAEQLEKLFEKGTGLWQN